VTTLPLGALFGREAIEDIELELAAVRHGRGKEEAEDRIETLGLRHGIASRKTSLVAISEDPTVDPKDPRRRERLAVEVPAEVSAEGAGLMQPVMIHAFSKGPMVFHDMCLEADEEASPLMRSMPGAPEFTRRLGMRFDWLTKGPKMAPTRKVDIVGARVLRLDGPVLIVEFEVPETGFLLPVDGTQVHVCFEDGSDCRARVFGDESSQSGPHQAGLTIRLAVKLVGRNSWHGQKVLLRWTGRVGPPDADAEELEIDMHIILGARP
jgi:hypothetical protein